MFKLITLVALFALAAAQKESFANYKVFRILPTNAEQNVLLHHISTLADGVSTTLVNV